MCVCVCAVGGGRQRIEESVKETLAKYEREKERERGSKRDTAASAQSLFSIYSPRPKYH